jgi:hypothetical protein
VNQWRNGYTGRMLFQLDGRWWTFRSEHPKEERIIELTDDYRDENGDFIPPEPVAPEPAALRLGDLDICIEDPS